MYQRHSGLIPGHVVADEITGLAKRLADHLDNLNALDDDGIMSNVLRKMSDLSIEIAQIGRLLQNAGAAEASYMDPSQQSFPPPSPSAAGVVPAWSPKGPGASGAPGGANDDGAHGPQGNGDPSSDPEPEGFVKVRQRHTRLPFSKGVSS